MELAELEGDAGRAELDVVAVGEDLRAVDLDPVDGHAVRRAEVVEHPAAAPGPDLRVAAGDVRVAEDDLALARAPEHGAAGLDGEALAVQAHPGRALPGAGALLERLGQALGGRVDHGVARVALGGTVVALLAARVDEAGLDAELAELEPVVGLEVDRRAGEQGEPLPARVLEQIAGELPAQRALRVGEAFAIVGREPHGVLVGHVDPVQGGRAVIVHLAGQLAGDLDRADLRPEGTGERPLDQAGDLALQGLEHAHSERSRCYGTDCGGPARERSRNARNRTMPHIPRIHTAPAAAARTGGASWGRTTVWAARRAAPHAAAPPSAAGREARRAARGASAAARPHPTTIAPSPARSGRSKARRSAASAPAGQDPPGGAASSGR